MKTKFYTDTNIERPFYERMVRTLSGNKTNNKLNGEVTYTVTCPKCGKRKAYMALGKQGTFFIKCFYEGKHGNSCFKGILNDLIVQYGDTTMKEEWYNSRNKKPYRETWFPIKSQQKKSGKNNKDFKKRMYDLNQLMRILYMK